MHRVFGVWRTLQPPEVRLPFTLATEPDLPLGFRLSQLEALHSGNHLSQSPDLHGAFLLTFLKFNHRFKVLCMVILVAKPDVF